MSQEPDPADLLARTAAEELLSDEGRSLPESMGRPPALPPPSPARRKLVLAGAGMTGLTLLVGIALIVLGAVELLGGSSGLFLGVVGVGVALVATHWGWVHVAEFTSNAIENRRNAEVDRERHRWLATLEPYTRYAVSTDVGADGSLTIATVRHRPVPTGENGFTFTREIVDSERHSDEEPAAVIAERAEQLRREAALLTERERERFQRALADRRQTALGQEDEEARLLARRAASEALAEQINTNLRDPPLTG